MTSKMNELNFLMQNILVDFDFKINSWQKFEYYRSKENDNDIISRLYILYSFIGISLISAL